MEIIGYSERGVINSLFYAIKASSNSDEILRDFLSLIAFPWTSPNFDVTKAILLIEQSFSDFGDADAVLLLETSAGRCAVFLEAKVKTTGRSTWTVAEEFAEFDYGIKLNKVSSSNLFTQIYHKVRMVTALNQGGVACLGDGIPFPACSSKVLRKIGQNPVVLRATELVSLFCGTSYFVAILPCSAGSIAQFAAQTLRNHRPGGFQDWSVDNWGYVTWSQVEGLCEKWGLVDVENTLRFNCGQIY